MSFADRIGELDTVAEVEDIVVVDSKVLEVEEG